MSLNDFFVNAIQIYLQMCDRRRIDAEFAAMAADTDYRQEALLIAGEFRASDWEAFARLEKSESSSIQSLDEVP